MLADGFDEDLDAGQLDRPKFLDDARRLVGGDAARTPVTDVAGRIERAEVAAGRDIVWTEGEVDADGLKYPAADIESVRVVAEEGEVPRSAAGGDAGSDRYRESHLRPDGKAIQVGRAGVLHLAAKRLRLGKTAQPIENTEDDLGRIGSGKTLSEFEVHGCQS